jgi:NAD(P)H-dependent FMN reductase
MNILILSGSRNRKGQTARAADAIAKGAKSAGAKTEIIFLTEHKIERCRQCENDGWGLCLKEGRCVINDDFASLAAKAESADFIVFATPVYFHDLSESMRSFLDRLRRIYSRRRMVPPSLGMAMPSPGMPSQPAAGMASVIGICYAGGSGFGTASCCYSLEHTLQTCGFDVVDMIPVRRQNIDFKLPLLEMTGKWITTRPVSGEFKPLQPPE